MPKSTPAASKTARLKHAAWRDNNVMLATLRHGRGYVTGAQLAELLDTTEPTMSRALQGESDPAGLPQAYVREVFPGNSPAMDLVQRAQLAECELRKIHAQISAEDQGNSEKLRDDLDRKLEECAELAMLLARWQVLLPPPADVIEKQEQALASAALGSLKAQISIYRASFRQAMSFLEKAIIAVDFANPDDLGTEILTVRLVILLYFARYKSGEKAPSRLIDKRFVRLATKVAWITRDERILFNLAEALGDNDLDTEAANLLCDAADMIEMDAAALPDHQPLGHEHSLRLYPGLVKALELAPQVSAARLEKLKNKLQARRDINGNPLESVLNDNVVHLTNF